MLQKDDSNENDIVKRTQLRIFPYKKKKEAEK